MDTIVALQGLASPTLDRVMLLVTNLCAQEVFTVLLVVTFMAIDPAFGRRLGLVFLLAAYANDLVKEAVSAPRPFEARPDVARSAAAVETATGSSFPSGHAQSAAVFWLFSASRVGRAWFWALAALIVVAVAFSRVYLGVHYPVDVIGGVAIGAAVVLLASALGRVRLAPGKSVVVVGGLVAPLALHLLLTTDSSHVYLSVASAFLVGPELVRHRASGGVGARAAMAVVGVVLVGAVLVTTSALMPAAMKEAPLPGYLRYLAIGFTGTLLAPLACRWARIGGRAAAAGSHGASQGASQSGS